MLRAARDRGAVGARSRRGGPGEGCQHPGKAPCSAPESPPPWWLWINHLCMPLGLEEHRLLPTAGARSNLGAGGRGAKWGAGE